MEIRGRVDGVVLVDGGEQPRSPPCAL